jgi:hypothetical protein
VAGRLSSYRFRRRLIWSGSIIVVVAALVAVSVKVGNTGHSSATKIDRTKKAWVYKEPASMKLTAADRRELYGTAVRFISSAVARKHLDVAWTCSARR